MGLPGAAPGGQPGQRDDHQSSAQAKCEQVGRLSRPACDGLDRDNNAVDDIILDRLVAQRLARVDPRHDEHCPAFVDQPLDQARSRLEIDHVVAVDQRRHVKQRFGGDLGRRRGILDELEQLILEDHLTGSRGNRFALDENRRVGSPADDPLAARDVLDQVHEALDKVCAAGFLDPRNHRRVGRGKIGGGDCVQILVEQEAGHRGTRLIASLGLSEHVAQLLRRQQVSIANGTEIGVVLPFGRGEAPVTRLLSRSQHRGPILAPLAHRVALHLEQVARARGQSHGCFGAHASDGERIEWLCRLDHG